MAPKAPKKLLKFVGPTLAPLVTERRFCNQDEVVKDVFWEKVEHNKTEVDLPFDLSSNSF